MKAQAKLRFPESVEFEKIVDVPYAYVVYVDYADGSCDILEPGEGSRVASTIEQEDGKQSTEWFWKGLRPAFLAVRRQYGKTIPIYITTAQGSRHHLSL